MTDQTTVDEPDRFAVGFPARSCRRLEPLRPSVTTPEKLLARQTLTDFFYNSWRTVEGYRRLWRNWHIPAIAEHLGACLAGQIKRLVISIPPGTSKSRIAGVALPAYAWLFNPALRFMFISNVDTLATRDSLACRRLVESQWYRETFGPTWTLQRDQDQKTWFQNTAGGERQSFGVFSSFGGRKADVIVLDDAMDANKAQQEVYRSNVIDAFENTIRDRLVDQVEGVIINIAQRTHENDLNGHLLKQGDWEHLLIPEEFDPADRVVTSIGWTDPRREKHELLRPKQYGEEQARVEKAANPMLYSAKRNQKPRSVEGIRFKALWLKKRWRWDDDGEHILLTDHRGTLRFHAFGEARMRYGTADGASSAKTSADFTVISSWLVSPRNDLLWIGCTRNQLEIPDQPDALQAVYRKHQLEFVGVEAVAGNVALFQFASRMNMNVRRLEPKQRDKLARAVPAINMAETGRLWLPDSRACDLEGFPIDDVIAELTAFTGNEKVDEHDDIVDTLSYAVEVHNLYGMEEGDAAPSGVPATSPQGFNPYPR